MLVAGIAVLAFDSGGYYEDARSVAGVVAWVLFAAVLLLRVAAGWRGRKAAIGTMLGFLCTMAVLIGYVLRGDAGVG